MLFENHRTIHMSVAFIFSFRMNEVLQIKFNFMLHCIILAFIYLFLKYNEIILQWRNSIYALNVKRMKENKKLKKCKVIMKSK